MVSYDYTKDDIVSFKKDDVILKIWDNSYFNDLVERFFFQ